MDDTSTIPATGSDMPPTRWLDEREQRAWRGYLAVRSELDTRLNHELRRDSSISLADFDVLVALSDRADRQVRVLELAEALSWEKSRLSHHLTRMRARDLVERQDCPGDARGAFVALTPHGRAVLDAAAPAHVDTVRALVFDGLDTDQVDTLIAAAETVLGRLRNGPTRSR